MITEQQGTYQHGNTMEEKKVISVCLKKSSDENAAAVVFAVDPIKTPGADGKLSVRSTEIITINYQDPAEADQFLIGKKYSITIKPE